MIVFKNTLTNKEMISKITKFTPDIAEYFINQLFKNV